MVKFVYHTSPLVHFFASAKRLAKKDGTINVFILIYLANVYRDKRFAAGPKKTNTQLTKLVNTGYYMESFTHLLMLDLI